MKTILLKRLILVNITIAVISSCGENSKQDNTSTKIKTVKNTIKTISKTENLLETTSLTNEALQDWFPNQLMSLQKTTTSIAPMSTHGINGAIANYDGNNKEKIKITLYDCSGEKGVLLLSQYSFYKNMTVDNENDYKIEKSFNKRGMEGIEAYDKNRQYSDISFLYNDRFGVNIKAYNMNRESVWESINNLKFDELLK